jgi:hypothetical protein
MIPWSISINDQLPQPAITRTGANPRDHSETKTAHQNEFVLA